MSKLFVVLSAMLLLSNSSCALREATTLSSDSAFLSFEGTGSGLEFRLEDLESIPISNPSRDVRYEIVPGTHTVTVSRDGIDVVSRVFFLSSGQSFVLRIPGEE
jgi:hypothetical protein